MDSESEWLDTSKSKTNLWILLSLCGGKLATCGWLEPCEMVEWGKAHENAPFFHGNFFLLRFGPTQPSWNTVFNKAGATRVGFWGNKALSGYNWDAKTKNVNVYIHNIYCIPTSCIQKYVRPRYVYCLIHRNSCVRGHFKLPALCNRRSTWGHVFVVCLETLRSEPHFKLSGLGASHRGIPTNFRTVWLLQKFFRNLTRSNTWNSYVYNWWFEHITYSQINEY